LDNGTARGTRIAWINTGAGLRYKVVLDRAMDIADTFYNQYSIAWLSHLGITPPERFSDEGVDWLHTFGGGLLVTCGSTHTGGPEMNKDGSRGLHGRISNLPAEIESVIQPDPYAGKMEMSITGKIRESKIFGPDIELKRTISGELGKSVVHIHDEITNRGNTSVPHMLLYHCNFGWPLVDEGTEILWQGDWKAGDEESKLIFKKGNDFRKCPPVLDEHKGAGEAVAFIDIDTDDEGNCICGLYNREIDLRLNLKFKKEQLPWLVNWQHWGQGEYVTGLEPATLPPIGQAKAKEQGTIIYLEPGESRNYELEFEIISNKN
jgi:galactose mutarotase-like enzyme